MNTPITIHVSETHLLSDYVGKKYDEEGNYIGQEDPEIVRSILARGEGKMWYILRIKGLPGEERNFYSREFNINNWDERQGALEGVLKTAARCIRLNLDGSP